MQEEDEYQNGCNIADHDDVHLFPAEALAVALHLADDELRRFDPADQDRGQKRDERHHAAVADVVHDVQQLRGGAVRQRDEHQAGAGAHAVGAGKDKDSRDDHDARQQGDARVKELNLARDLSRRINFPCSL